MRGPEPDTYGQYARASLLADYAELLALRGERVRRSLIADFLADAGWRLELIIGSEGPGASRAHELEDDEEGSLSERRDAADEQAEIVFAQLAERLEILGERYPFSATAETLDLRAGKDPCEEPYVALLALTVAHAFRLEVGEQPAQLFEEVVTQTLAERGLQAMGLASLRRDGLKFLDAVATACTQLGLRAVPGSTPLLRHAHDEGVDTICHLSWGDERPGAWAFIGQVTVGRSDTWERKLKEPSPDRWGKLLGTGLPPLPFLAVPHHVERFLLARLVDGGRGLVLDRLRLARFRSAVTAGERSVVQAVLDEEPEPLSG